MTDTWTSEKLLATLKDDGIKQAVRKALKGRRVDTAAKSLIDRKEMGVIIKAALDHGTINSVEHKDLKLLLKHANLGSKSEARLEKFLDERANRKVQVDRKRLKGKDLAPIAHALERYSSGPWLNFKNPFGYSYVPSMYKTILNMILDDEILVYSYHHGHGDEKEAVGKRAGGVYKSAANQLNLASSSDKLFYDSIIVHEVTHAIQDYRNWKMRVKHVEADAYIAQATVYMVNGKDSKAKGLSKVALKCAEQLMKKKADRTFGETDVHYAKLVEAIGEHKLYAKNKDEMRHHKSEDQDKDELSWLWYSAD